MKKKDQTLISIKLSKELLKAVQDKVMKEETTVSAIVRNFLINYIKTND